MFNLNLRTAGIKECRRDPPNSVLPYLARWQNNTSRNDLGIVKFIFDIHTASIKAGFPPPFKDFRPQYGTAPWARHALYEYHVYEPGMLKEDRCHVYATYRGGSKTQWFVIWMSLYETCIGQYGIYFHEYLMPEVDFSVTQCKNSKEAMMRLMTISTLFNKPFIQHCFGDLKPTYKEVKSKEAKDTGSLLILSNGHAYQASGILQPSRGLNILGARPKKITFDDPQNKNNTKTKEAREDCDKQVMDESIGAVTDDGSIHYIGNKVHAEDTLGKLLSAANVGWKKHFYTYTVKIDDKGVRHPGIGDLDTEVPEWGRRYTIESIRKKKEWFQSQPQVGGYAAFMRNYYNKIISEEDVLVKYHDGVFLREHGTNWLRFALPDGKYVYRNVYIIIGVDPAISERETADDACIVVYACDCLDKPDSPRRRFVLEYKKGKYDIDDRYYNDSARPALWARTPEELANIKRQGIPGIIGRLMDKYFADAVVMENAGQQLTFFNQTVALLQRGGYYPIFYPYAVAGKGSKIDRIKNNLLCYAKAGLFYIRLSMASLKSELDTFPHSGLHILDSINCAEQLAKFNPRVQYNPLSAPISQDNTIKDSYDNDVKKFMKETTVTKTVEPWICT